MEQSLQSKDKLESLIPVLMQNAFYSEISNTLSFKRLKKISFLGAIDYSQPKIKLAKLERSRHNHSLMVAALAHHVCFHRKYDYDLQRHLVAAALLHDIGHAPLSHSMEPQFKISLGVGHHELGNQIISGRSPLGKELYQLLNSSVNIDFVLSILDGNYHGEGSDLFNNKINIDTIDGITRADKYSSGIASLSPLEITNHAFLSSEPDRLEILDKFWHLKNKIYAHLIQSNNGLHADTISQNYFELKRYVFSEEDLFLDEIRLKKKHSLLFDMLESLSRKNPPQPCTAMQEVSYVKKTYILDKKSTTATRYIHKKEKILHKFFEQKNETLCIFG